MVQALLHQTPAYRHFTTQQQSSKGHLAQPCRRHQSRTARCRVVANDERPKSRLWRPDSQRSLLVPDKADASGQIYAGQGPQPPNPMVVERFSQVISQLFQQRIVRLGGAVDDDNSNLLVAQLLYLDSMGKKDITMYVNSPGGSVTAGMATFDTMRYIKSDVSTVCVGLAASMGAFILAAGQKGKRYSLANSRMMIHQPLGGAQGQAADIEIQANEILHHKLTLNGYLAEFTGQGMERITADTDRDFFMSAKEAVDYGLIDGIISKPALMASQMSKQQSGNGSSP